MNRQASPEHDPSVQRLSRDLRKASETLSAAEARFLVDAYYISQEDRKRAHNQVRSMPVEPHVLIGWLAEQGETLETQIKSALDVYTDKHPSGRWMKSVYGIGPVIAAGFLAHIDITRSPTVGHIYSFAGIAGDGQKAWAKGERRPFNAALKTLCWKTGQSFMKFSGNEECFYGAIYRERKAREVARNESGGCAGQAAAILEAKRIGKTTEAFKHLTGGKLPPAQIDGRARRFAVKMFLSHMHCVMFWLEHQTLPPNPYALDQAGHAHFIRMPNIDLVPGLGEALSARGLIFITR